MSGCVVRTAGSKRRGRSQGGEFQVVKAQQRGRITGAGPIWTWNCPRKVGRGQAVPIGGQIIVEYLDFGGGLVEFTS